ncbi:MAG: hypothetical protein ABFC89_12090 [Methanospirillum sp.]
MEVHPLRPSLLRACGLLVCLSLLACGALAASTDVRVVKLAADGKTVLSERTVDYHWLEANLPVRGDGSTHYYHQGPTFDDADLWDPTESKNVQDKDMGAVKGTALRDLCGLVGGMQSGDALVVRASDGFSKRFSYGSVYSPSARQGQMVLTWYRADEGYVPSYSTGMRIVFYADTSTNPWGLHVFGNADMKASMPSSEWHYFNGVYPTTTGLSVQSVGEIRILSTQSAATTTATTRTTTAATTAAKTTAPTQKTTDTTTTKTTTLPGTSGTTAAPTTVSGATTVPASSAVSTTTPLSIAATTFPTDDGGSGAIGTTAVTPTNATTNSSSSVQAPTRATPFSTQNETGNVTPAPTESPVPTSTGYDRTYDYSITTGLDYVSDLDEAGTTTVTATPTPTLTANATESSTATTPATRPVTASPSFAPSSAPTVTQSSGAAARSLSFTFSFQVRESGNGPAIDASPGGSAAIISPASPLGAIWAFMKAIARLIDPFFT